MIVIAIIVEIAFVILGLFLMNYGSSPNTDDRLAILGSVTLIISFVFLALTIQYAILIRR
jgi:hypothetical protein